MKVDKYGQVAITEDEAFQALYNGKIKNFNNVFVDDHNTINQFNSAVLSNADKLPHLSALLQSEIDIEDFDQVQQAKFFMPQWYQESFDIKEWLHAQCRSEQEHARVDVELPMFAKHGMFDLLKYLKFLVDTMRREHILWGVGRGSSVSSFVLYLIGVHRINPLTYNLDINEFLK